MSKQDERMGGSEGEVARIRELLKHLIELAGLSQREVETRLLEQGCGTDLGRLLSGRVGLRVRHVLDICRVIELYPQELFHIIFKESAERSPLLERLDALTRESRPRAARGSEQRPAERELEEINRRLGEIERRLSGLTPG
jgi:hypothetical protein